MAAGDHTFSSPHCGVAISWDRGSKDFDLDLQAVAFSSAGRILDAVYYNNLKAFGTAMTHSGDQETGAKQGYDEVVWVDTSKLREEVQAIVYVIAAYSEGKVLEASNVKCHLLQDNYYEAKSFVPKEIKGQAGVFGVLLKEASTWAFRHIEESATDGHHFVDILEPTIGNVVRSLLPSAPQQIQAMFDMSKGSSIDLPRNFRQTCVGVSWDNAGGDLDVDLSAVLLNQELEKVETVFSANLEAKGVKRSGNAGKVDGGDNAVIAVLTNEIVSEVQQIYVLLHIRSDDKSLSDLTRPRCRFFKKQGEQEAVLSEFNLTMAGDKTGLIIARLYRSSRGASWAFQLVGEPCQGRSCQDSLQDIQKHAKDNQKTMGEGAPPEPQCGCCLQ